jgi:hypothetical protein
MYCASSYYRNNFNKKLKASQNLNTKRVSLNIMDQQHYGIIYDQIMEQVLSRVEDWYQWELGGGMEWG